MTLRPIEDKYIINKQHWVGSAFRVANIFPEGKNLLERFSPFVLLDYAKPLEFTPSSSPRGVSPHPHRGLETVTFAIEGSVEHHDNVGNHGIIWPGDVQWMNSGEGILHKEYHEKNFQQKGGWFSMIQLWISLPKKDKWSKPRYQAIKNQQMGKYPIENNGGEVSVVAGEFKNIKGPALTFSPMNVYMINLSENSILTFEEPGDFNTGLLNIFGKSKINKSHIQEGEFVLFKNKSGKIVIESQEDKVKILVLSGQDLKEPTVASGTFVMNTQEEIDQANEDYRRGVFGDRNF